MNADDIARLCYLDHCIDRTCGKEVTDVREHEVAEHGIVRCPDCFEMAQLAEAKALELKLSHECPLYMRHLSTVPRLVTTWFGLGALLCGTDIEEHFATTHHDVNPTHVERSAKAAAVRKVLADNIKR